MLTYTLHPNLPNVGLTQRTEKADSDDFGVTGNWAAGLRT